MHTRISLSLLLITSLCGCTGNHENKIDFSKLNDDEKRLPQNALTSMNVAEGLEVELFAAEPMVTNPTNISIDRLGRVWVCEAYNYDVSPEEEDPKGDRIVVLEDTDKDGKADKRTVFYQGTDINTPLGIFVAGEKIYVSRSPNVFVFTDRDGDLIPESKDTLFTNLGPDGDHSAHSILPGPDGMLYFSTGNMAGQILDRHGDPVVDRAGFTITQKGDPYLGGMILRFDVDGKNVEVLGHNFRNNYEPCVDSYGNVWQSDNDDDGYESCRINFIMPYGNYGYVDEMTRASWMTSRVGMEETTSDRHWHQNDPGVVPNVLITGAGSPAGMVWYDGRELPEAFSETSLHAEPYYNAVRAYIPEKYGAGYRAKIKNLLKSDDQWFRPVDVSVAPDGSVFIADWYDPILGGGAAGDAGQGRIYRIAKDVGRYELPDYQFTTPGSTIDALQSPNPESRFKAFHLLKSMAGDATADLLTLWRSDDPLIRVRAFWILAALQNEEIIREAMSDRDPRIRIAAAKAAVLYSTKPEQLLKLIKDDTDPHVQRELLTSLRYSNTAGAATLWTEMAAKYDGIDRWYLEALGIASDLHADSFFNAWTNRKQPDLAKKEHQDILWRIRSAATLPYLKEMIMNSSDAKAIERWFRAFDFHKDPAKNQVLMSLLNLPREDASQIAALALQQMDAAGIRRTELLDRALARALQETKGSLAYVDLVHKFDLKDKVGELIKMAQREAGTAESNAAMDQLMKFRAFNELERQLQNNDSSVVALMKNMEGKSNPDLLEMLSGVAKDGSRTLSVRQAALRTLGSSWPGEEKLLALVKEDTIDDELKPLAASILFNVYRSSIQREAATVLEAPASRGTNLPTVKELVASSGNSKNGQHVFEQYCQSCHKVSDTGTHFGPELTQIGSKLSRDGLYRAIIFPDEGINHGYSSTLVTLKDGARVMGIVVSETDTDLTISVPGGITNRYPREQIATVEPSGRSMMPALAQAMEKQELVDLVTYLSDLKK